MTLTSRLLAAPTPSTWWSSNRRSRPACCYGDAASWPAPCRRSPAAPVGETPSASLSSCHCHQTSWPCWPETWQVTMTTGSQTHIQTQVGQRGNSELTGCENNSHHVLIFLFFFNLQLMIPVCCREVN